MVDYNKNYFGMEFPEYEYREYPKWIDNGKLLVQNADEESAYFAAKKDDAPKQEEVVKQPVAPVAPVQPFAPPKK
jgi:hypothetical protein